MKKLGIHFKSREYFMDHFLPLQLTSRLRPTSNKKPYFAVAYAFPVALCISSRPPINNRLIPLMVWLFNDARLNLQNAPEESGSIQGFDGPLSLAGVGKIHKTI